MVIFESVFLRSLKVCVTGIECVCVCGILETQQEELLTQENHYLGVCYLGDTLVRITDWKSLCLNLDTSQHDTDVCSLKAVRMEQERRMARRCSVVVRLPLDEHE